VWVLLQVAIAMKGALWRMGVSSGATGVCSAGAGVDIAVSVPSAGAIVVVAVLALSFGARLSGAAVVVLVDDCHPSQLRTPLAPRPSTPAAPARGVCIAPPYALQYRRRQQANAYKQ